MRRINLFLTMLFTIAAISSCNLIPWEDLTENMNKDIDTFSKSKIYKGGNVDCSQVADEYPQLNLMQTTGRNDYDPSTDSFAFDWPVGLAVEVMDDGSVSFQIDGAIDLGDGKCYKIGAVIVKGGTASNIYTYPDGTTQDIGLVAPDNASATPAGLSNLTFCFVECEEKEPVVVAIKARYSAGDTGDETLGEYYLAPETKSAAASDGIFVFNVSGCNWIGMNEYPGTTSFFLRDYFYRSDVVGYVSVTEAAGKLTVTVTLKGNGELLETRFFIGSEEEFRTSLDSEGCSDFTKWHYDYSISNSVSYSIDY